MTTNTGTEDCFMNSHFSEQKSIKKKNFATECYLKKNIFECVFVFEDERSLLLVEKFINLSFFLCLPQADSFIESQCRRGRRRRRRRSKKCYQPLF